MFYLENFVNERETFLDKKEEEKLHASSEMTKIGGRQTAATTFLHAPNA
jgi:hypothetical protein